MTCDYLKYFDMTGNNKKKIDIIGSQMDLGAVRKGVDMGPLAIRHTDLLQRLQEIGYMVYDRGDVIPAIPISEGNPKMRYEKEINDANKKLFSRVKTALKNNAFPIVLGGDHSIAIGSISACCEFYHDIGIIWVDAHGDFNDDVISPSGNIHGMPLSALCGCGPESLISFTDARVNPIRVVIIGARDIDPLEKIKLKKCGVTIFSISDVHAMGIQQVINKSIEIATEGTEGVYLSFDMDALDPTQAPGVGTPVLNGLTAREAFIISESLFLSNALLGIDLVETNPLLDKRNITGILASELIITCVGKTAYCT